jgi:hypothetical protein
MRGIKGLVTETSLLDPEEVSPLSCSITQLLKQMFLIIEF